MIFAPIGRSHWVFRRGFRMEDVHGFDHSSSIR
jgi:hypothetical protein